MNAFLRRHAAAVTGTLSGFDRVRFRGTVRLLANAAGLGATMAHLGVLLKDFKGWATGLSEALRTGSLALAEAAGRPVRYLASAQVRKEDVARQIARDDGIERGLICVLTAVEPCWSFHVRRDPKQQRLVLESSWRKCLHLYHYFAHEELGFCHARVQSWLPFNVHVCVNGREWLARQMGRAGVGYVRRENCFAAVGDAARAQALFDEQLTVDWAGLLDGLRQAAQPSAALPLVEGRPLDYYWSADESEWATDVMFRSPAALSAVYPSLVRHGVLNLSSADVMRFLGAKGAPTAAAGAVQGNFTGEVVTDLRRRAEGVRVKHRVNANSVKMYDKQGSVLRVETTVNDTRAFKVFRTPEGSRADTKPSWQKMRKGVADMARRAAVCQAANGRYLDAMATVADDKPLRDVAAPLCRPVTWKGRSARGLNVLSDADAALLEYVGRGEFALNGFRNRDLRGLLFKTPTTETREARRRSGRVTRLIRLLRAHGLVHKVPKTHRYVVSPAGRTAITAVLSARQADTAKLVAAAAA
jgi:hypothetical protein